MKRIFSLLLWLGFSLWSAALPAQGVITGQLTDAGGDPLPGAHVKVLETGDLTIADETGLYRIEGLQPGTYHLRFSFVGFKPVVRTTVVKEGTSKTILHLQLKEEVIQLQGLEVRANRNVLMQICPSALVSSKKITDADDARDLPYILQTLPSVLVTSDAGAGIGYTDLRIRGVDATRINVTINGIPVNDAESQKVYWVDMPDILSSLNDLQVQYGLGSSSLGAGAFGANLNLSTLGDRSKPAADVRLALGSFNTRRATFAYSSGLLGPKARAKKAVGAFLSARLSRISSDGYIDRASSNLRSYYAEAGYRFPEAELRFVAFGGHERTYQAWYGVPARFIDDPEQRTYNPAGTEKPGEPYPDEVDDYTQQHYQLFFKKRLNRNCYLNLAAHYTKGFGYYEQYKAGQNLGDYGLVDSVFCQAPQTCTTDLVRRRWLDNDFYGGVWGLHYTNNPGTFNLSWAGGLNRYEGLHYGEVIWAQLYGQNEKDWRYYEDEATKSEANTFVKATYTLRDRLNFRADLQLRRVKYAYTYRQLGEKAEDTRLFFNPKLGLSYDLAGQSRLFAFVALAHREPNRNDYVDASPQSVPRPERMVDYELGFRQMGDKLSAAITLYYMDYRDQLVLNGKINDVGEYTRVNIPRSYRRGLELQLGYHPTADLAFSLNATLSQNRIVYFEEYVDAYGDLGQYFQEVFVWENTPLAFSPSLMAKGGLQWALPFGKRSWSLRFFTQYVSGQYINNAGDERAYLNPYFVSEARIAWKRDLFMQGAAAFGASRKREKVGSLHLFLQVNNLFNALYATNAWAYKFYDFPFGKQYVLGYYPQATRNFMAGLRMEFSGQ